MQCNAPAQGLGREVCTGMADAVWAQMGLADTERSAEELLRANRRRCAEERERTVGGAGTPPTAGRYRSKQCPVVSLCPRQPCSHADTHPQPSQV